MKRPFRKIKNRRIFWFCVGLYLGVEIAVGLIYLDWLL